MTTFEDRERGFEAKFAHGQDVRFRIIARRDKLVGRRAADQVGLDAAGREAFVQLVLGVARRR